MLLISIASKAFALSLEGLELTCSELSLAQEFSPFTINSNSYSSENATPQVKAEVDLYTDSV